MPDSVDLALLKWWQSLPEETIIKVRYPHERHGNAGKTSHSAKTSAKDDFLQFIDNNSQPNGRSADTSGPTHYFLPKVTTIQSPKPGVPNYQERVA